MITADNITDEQIRELRGLAQFGWSPWDAQGYGPSDIIDDCDVALFDTHAVGAKERRVAARERLSEILKARSAK